MASDDTRPRLVMTAAIALITASELVGQTPVALQFGPDVGVRLHTVVTTEGGAVIGEQGAPVGSGIALQFRRREAITLQTLEQQGEVLVIQVTHDSVASRARPAGGLWEGVAEEMLPPGTARLLVNGQLSVQSVLEGTLRTGLVGGFDLTLPTAPVMPGDRWDAELGLPVHGRATIRAELNLDEGFRIDGRLVANATFVVDSIVPRSTDTLVYVDVSGNVRPRTMTRAAETSGGSVSASGAIGGSLIWSTGWSTFVSGAIRSIVVLGVRMGVPGQDEDVAFEVRNDATTQFQLRP